MATIQRPIKTYGTRRYVDEVALAPSNEDPVLANEVDADLDTVYAAWNAGADTVNIKDGAVTRAKLDTAVGAVVDGTFPGAIGLTPRGLINPGPTALDVRGNDPVSPQYDPANNQAFYRIDYQNAQHQWWSKVGAGTYQTVMSVDSVGNLGLLGKLSGANISNGSITQQQLAPGSSRRNSVGVAAPANAVMEGPFSTNFITLPTLTTSGGIVWLFGCIGWRIAISSGSAAVAMRLQRAGVDIFIVQYTVSGTNIAMPLPTPFTIDTPTAGSYEYRLVVSAPASITIVSDPTYPGSFNAYEFA